MPGGVAAMTTERGVSGRPGILTGWAGTDQLASAAMCASARVEVELHRRNMYPVDNQELDQSGRNGGMIHGTLIGDSLRIGAELHPEGWSVTRIYRLDVSGDPAEEDNAWTVIDFDADDDRVADALGQALAESLEAGGGWYADFRVGEDHVVIFAGKQFRYSRGDADGRAEALAYGRSVGVPEHQLDWVD